MKRIALSFAFGAVVLTGCAGWGGGSSTPAYTVDEQRVGAIETAARRTGVQVIWLNQPVKKTGG